MQPTTEQITAWEQAQWEQARKIAAIHFAIKENHTWSSDHPDSIRQKIKELNQILFEAEATL